MTIKKQYFDEILSGKKKEEYRLVKPHWVNKLVGKDYSHIIFQNGYSRNAPRLEAEYLGYEVRNIRHDFFGNDEVCVFALKLGTINMGFCQNCKAHWQTEWSKVKCDLCSYEWTAVRPAIGLTKLECPECSNMVYFENVE